MTENTVSALRRLVRLKNVLGTDVAAEKLALLRTLERGRLPRATDVARLHEVLCFMRAYPDNAEQLAMVERILDNFTQRKDLIRHRQALMDSGIAGTAIYYSFYWLTARWLLKNWPGAISIDWSAFDQQDQLEEWLPLLLPLPDALGVDSLTLSPKEWIDKLKDPTETDAAFLIRRFEKWHVDHDTCEKIYEDLDVPLCLEPGANTPSRTHSKYTPARIVFEDPVQTRPLVSVYERLHYQPLSRREVSTREGQRLIDLARVQMITRSRDLFAFMNADCRDVQVLDYDDGLQFVCYGLRPEQRLLLEAMYVFVILKNGVPIGYTQASTLFRSAEINFNVFDTFRGTETSWVFLTTLSMVRNLFASDTFIINPQQLGEDNPEALKSGAFWFYYKHGFRPKHCAVRKVMKTELARKKSNPGHRSSLATLKRLSVDNLFFYLDKRRDDVISRINNEGIGRAYAHVFANQGGAQQERALRDCAQQVAQRVGLSSLNNLTRPQRMAWNRWSPMLVALPGLSRWSDANKRALIEIIKAKAGRREIEYVNLFDRHPLLPKVIWKLSRTE